MTDLFILGAGMTAFGNHGPGTGRRLAMAAARAAMADAELSFRDIDAVVVGSGHPLSPRGIYISKDLGLTGVPVQHVSNASATGLAAIHAAAESIRAGNAKRVLVVGVDAPETAMHVEDVITGEGNFPPVVSFALWAKRRMHDAGTTREHMAMIAAKNWNYARTNEYAARRSGEPVTIERVLASKLVADPFTSMMCTPWGEGAAAVVLGASSCVSMKDRRRPIRLAASEFQSDRYSRELILAGAIVGPPELSRVTTQAALAKSGLHQKDVDVVQVHDAFAVEEIMYYELLGFSSSGETEHLIEAGAFGPDSRKKFGLPEFSTDGGLIARGHPGGPTGLAQVWETVRRLRTGTGDRVGLCHLLGAGSVCLAQVFVRE